MTGCTAVEGVLQHLMFHKAMIDEALEEFAEEHGGHV